MYVSFRGSTDYAGATSWSKGGGLPNPAVAAWVLLPLPLRMPLCIRATVRAVAARAAHSEEAGAHNLQPGLTSFDGRSAQLERLEELLARHRLVTVTGPGGVGKTRVWQPSS